MFLLKKVSVLCGICSAVLLLNACANAVFPEIEDEEEITVGEGGRVVRTLPKEGNSLKADEANRAYEGEEESETPANDSVEQIIEKDESVAAVETKPVLSEEKTAPKQESGKTAKAAEASVSDMSILTESSVPSVSYRLDTFYFADGSSVLDSEYNGNIRKIVKEAKANNATVTVYGYASSRTRNTDVVSHKMANFRVSLARAESVAAALRRAGLPASRITVEALSDTAPAYLEVMPEGERLNRRAEVYISY
mgnify:CR=1 FL=1